MSDWKTGETVQAGFMQVTVKAALLDSVYIVANAAGTTLYKFIPHNGIHKITVEQAKMMLTGDKSRREAMEAQILEFQARRREVNEVFA